MSENTSEVTTEVVEEVAEAAPVQETDPVAALTADLQRLQAEYANYRKRVERDRAVAHELAIGAVLTELLATLDDIDRAATHNELTGGFKAVADQLTSITSRLGLEKYGSEGKLLILKSMRRYYTTHHQMLQLQPPQRFCNRDTNIRSASCALLALQSPTLQKLQVKQLLNL